MSNQRQQQELRNWGNQQKRQLHVRY